MRHVRPPQSRAARRSPSRALVALVALSGLLALEAAPLQAQAAQAATAAVVGGALAAVGEGPEGGTDATQPADPAPEGEVTDTPVVDGAPEMTDPSPEVAEPTSGPVRPAVEPETVEPAVPSAPSAPSGPGLDPVPGDVARVDPRTDLFGPSSGTEVAGRAGPEIFQWAVDASVRVGSRSGGRFATVAERGVRTATTVTWAEEMPDGTWVTTEQGVSTTILGTTVTTSLKVDLGRKWVPSDEGKRYKVTITADGGTVEQVVQLKVWDFLVTDPESAEVTEGATATFTSIEEWEGPGSRADWKQRAPSAVVWSAATDGVVATEPHKTSYTTPATTLAMHGTQYQVAYAFCFVVAQCGIDPMVVDAGPATLSVLPATPIITKQPVDAPVDPGADASFEVGRNLSVAPEATIQWQVSTNGGANWDVATGTGATTSKLTLSSVTTGMDGNQYKAVITNTNGSPGEQNTVVVESTAATLRVTSPLAIVEQPTTLPVTEGGTATLTSSITGPPGTQVQWQRYVAGTWTPVDSGTNRDKPVYTTAPTTLSMHDARYRVVITNGGVTLESREVALTVWPAVPVIMTHPFPTGGTEGESATFSVVRDTAVAPGATVQWWVQPAGGAWAKVEGAVGTDLDLGPLTLAQDGNRYKAVFTNTNGSPDPRGTVTVESSVATLSVLRGDLIIATQPVDTPVDERADATFTASFGGTSGGVYSRWRSSGDGGETWKTEGNGWSLVYEVGGLSSWTVRGASYDDHHDRLYRAEFSVTPSVDGTAVSTTAARLTVTPSRPRIPVGPTDLDLDEGASGTFTSTVHGGVGTSMAWDYRVDGSTAWVPVPDEDSASLDLDDVTAAMDGRTYRLTVWGAVYGIGSQATARLAVSPRTPAVERQPTSIVVNAGGEAVFTSSLKPGTPTATVQWYSLALGADPETGWKDVVGATEPDLTVVGVTPEHDGTQYRATYTNGWVEGRKVSVDTAPATATVLSPPRVVESPLGITVTEGTPHTFTATYGDGTGTSIYVQWQRSTDDVSWTDIGSYSRVDPLEGKKASLLIAADEMTLDLDGTYFRAVFSASRAMTNGVPTNSALLRVRHTPPSSTITLTPRAYQVEELTTP